MGIEVYADLNREQEKRKKCVEGSLRCKEHLRKSQAKKKKALESEKVYEKAWLFIRLQGWPTAREMRAG